MSLCFQFDYLLRFAVITRSFSFLHKLLPCILFANSDRCRSYFTQTPSDSGIIFFFIHAVLRLVIAKLVNVRFVDGNLILHYNDQSNLI